MCFVDWIILRHAVVIKFCDCVIGCVELSVSVDHWPEHGWGGEGVGVAAKGEASQNCYSGELEAWRWCCDISDSIAGGGPEDVPSGLQDQGPSFPERVPALYKCLNMEQYISNCVLMLLSLCVRSLCMNVNALTSMCIMVLVVTNCQCISTF